MRRRIAVAVAVAAAGLAARRRAATTAGHVGVLDAGQVRRLYDRLAPVYDVLASPYGMLGAGRLVSRGIAALQLSPGDTVVVLGRGTGAWLPELAAAVAAGGRVVGVDLSPGMLELARARMADRRDVDVDLVQDDVRAFAWPTRPAGVLATFALEMVPGYDRVIAEATAALAPARGRLAVCGPRRPGRWPSWAVRTGVALGRPFGVREDCTSFRPREAVQRHTAEVVHETAGGGAVYLSVGEAG